MDTFQLAGIRKGDTMAFLVKDLVDRQIFGGVRLVAGVLNVSNPILWVNVMEILDTPRSLNEGELVVSTGYGLEDQSLHKDLIHQLKKRGSAVWRSSRAIISIRSRNTL